MIVMRTFSVTGLIALAGCGVSVADLRPDFSAPRPTPAVAPAPTPVPAPIMTAKERLLAAIEGRGCELSAGNASAIMTNATISADELKTLIPQLQTEGRVEVKNSGAIRVISPNCVNA